MKSRYFIFLILLLAGIVQGIRFLDKGDYFSLEQNHRFISPTIKKEKTTLENYQKYLVFYSKNNSLSQEILDNLEEVFKFNKTPYDKVEIGEDIDISPYQNFIFTTDIFLGVRKVEILEKALKDEDINVIHYAAVELNRIDVELQKNIKEAEKTGDKHKLYQAYREYINSGILKDFMLTFYLEKTLDLLLELSGEKGKLREELLTIYERLDKKDEYEKLLQNLIAESEKRELVELMLEFLYKENRYEEMLKYYKKYSNSGAVLPEIFQGEVSQ